MRVLHLVNDFNFTKVHKELVRHLDCLNIEQDVFIPLKDVENVGKNEFDFIVKDSNFIYSVCLRFYHKILYHRRVSFLFNSLISQIKINSIDIVHASTLFADGGLALRLKQTYGIKYVVAVRNSDLNFYMKYRKDLFKYGLEILENADKIIFISNSNLELFRKIFSKQEQFLRCIADKFVVQNNGINNAWLDSTENYSKNNNLDKSFLFIGRFDKNKNVLNLISAFKSLNKEFSNRHKLILVGGYGKLHHKVLKTIKNRDDIVFKGQIDNVQELIFLMKKVDFFTMCSFKETFGLVYLEALSQGKPILYSMGQGIDGTFANNLVGEAVNSKSIESIKGGLVKLLSSDYYQINHVDFKMFSWQNIAEKYYKLYKNI
ncbi:glycosyltransferase [Myroides odoratimimus]|uniref:glycosyltransferase n=1 Tax=Myroides odoratimimus TaxID=76832 RepID=UPI0025779482|nr:glycosyltransferase [Myroides odoratimimus]MDM1460874.1 glycosyltransferase [Myroides odoratimimus]